jgi:hypothetical protein
MIKPASGGAAAAAALADAGAVRITSPGGGLAGLAGQLAVGKGNLKATRPGGSDGKAGAVAAGVVATTVGAKDAAGAAARGGAGGSAGMSGMMAEMAAKMAQRKARAAAIEAAAASTGATVGGRGRPSDITAEADSSAAGGGRVRHGQSASGESTATSPGAGRGDGSLASVMRQAMEARRPAVAGSRRQPSRAPRDVDDGFDVTDSSGDEGDAAPPQGGVRRR